MAISLLVLFVCFCLLSLSPWWWPLLCSLFCRSLFVLFEVNGIYEDDDDYYTDNGDELEAPRKSVFDTVVDEGIGIVHPTNQNDYDFSQFDPKVTQELTRQIFQQITHQQQAAQDNRQPAQNNRRTGRKKKLTTPPIFTERPETERELFSEDHRTRQEARGTPPHISKIVATTRNMASAAAAGGADPGADAQNNEQQPKDSSTTTNNLQDQWVFWNGKKVKTCNTLKQANQELLIFVSKAETLRQELAQAREKIDQLASKNAKSNQNDAVSEKAKKLVVKHFRTCKFIMDDKDEWNAGVFIYNKMYDEQKRKDAGKNHMNEWVNTYRKIITTAVNSRRSYYQKRLRVAFMELAKDLMAGLVGDDAIDAFEFPTIDLIKRCTLRTINLHSNLELGVFAWYWGKVLGKFGKVPIIFVIFPICDLTFSTFSL